MMTLCTEAQGDTVIPYKLCECCKKVVDELPFLSLSWQGFKNSFEGNFHHRVQHYPDAASLSRGAKELGHWCNLVLAKGREHDWSAASAAESEPIFVSFMASTGSSMNQPFVDVTYALPAPNGD